MAKKEQEEIRRVNGQWSVSMIAQCGNLTSRHQDSIMGPIWIGIPFGWYTIQPEIYSRYGVIQVIGWQRVYGWDHLSLDATGIISDTSATLASIDMWHVKQTNKKHQSQRDISYCKIERLTHHNVVIVARCFVVSRIEAWRFKVKVQESQSNTSVRKKCLVQ